MALTCVYKCDPLFVTVCHCLVISLLYLRSPISKVDSQINSSLFLSFKSSVNNLVILDSC